MSHFAKSAVTTAAAAVFATLSFAAAEAGDCRHGKTSKVYNTTKSTPKPAQAKILTLSPKPKRTAKKQLR